MSSAPAALASGHLPLGAPNRVSEPEWVFTAVGASSVRVRPSTRTVIGAVAASAADAGSSASSATAPHPARNAPPLARSFFCFMRATPFHEGYVGFGRALSPGLRAYRPRLPGESSSPVALIRPASPITVAVSGGVSIGLTSIVSMNQRFTSLPFSTLVLQLPY